MTVGVDPKDLENIMNYARRCAEDLKSEVEAHHPGDHPVTVRRRERNMVEAKWLLSALPALAVKYDVEMFD